MAADPPLPLLPLPDQDLSRLSADQAAELEAGRADQWQTRRPTADGLDALLGQAFAVLDHGFVRVVDYMGDDGAVVQAARVSYGRGTKAVSTDRGLIRYLMRHWHSTPFEMCEIKLHVKLPIFVARQWIRHRTANVNEISARYSILDREFYLPASTDLAAQSDSNRQGRGDALSASQAEAVRTLLRTEAERDFSAYEDLLGDAANPDQPGIARELARMALPLSTYTQWYWKTDLHNLMHFLHLRADPHAQYEIRAYAEVMMALAQRWVPLTMEAFSDYRLGAFSLSAPMLAVVQAALCGTPISPGSAGLSKRELAELVARLPGLAAHLGDES